MLNLNLAYGPSVFAVPGVWVLPEKDFSAVSTGADPAGPVPTCQGATRGIYEESMRLCLWPWRRSQAGDVGGTRTQQLCC